jgi:WD40 repeat protein
VAFSPDSQTFATVGDDRSVQITRVENGSSREFRSCPTFLTHIRYSPDGRRLLSAGTDGKVRLWSVQTGDELTVISPPTAGFAHVEISEDGSSLVVSSQGAYAFHSASRTKIGRLSVVQLKEFTCIEPAIVKYGR